jgi:hypothetical protein
LLPIDPADGQGGVAPAFPQAVPAKAVPAVPSKAVPSKAVPPKTVPSNTVPSKTVPPKAMPSTGGPARKAGPSAAVPTETLPHAMPPQAMAHGGTIIRPGAVAWGGSRKAQVGGYSSHEAIERSLAEVTRDPGRFPGLLAELATARLWVPLPARRRPFTDGTAVRLPVVGLSGTSFVPCFTSVQRLTSWAESPGAVAMRAGDSRTARVVPHIVVPAAGLADRLPSGFGLAINPDSTPGVPIYPECVPYLARLGALARPAATAAPGFPRQDRPPHDRSRRTPVRELAAVSLAPPPAEPTALLDETRRVLRGVAAVAEASRAWLTVPGHGEGLVIAVTLDDPKDETSRRDVVAALERAVAAIPLRVPFPLDVTFPGEPVPGQPGPDVIVDWMTRNTRPFYTRD